MATILLNKYKDTFVFLNKKTYICSVMSKLKNFSEGDLFGDLTVMNKILDDRTQTYYLCKCSCGGIRELQHTKLKSGRVTHCGCKNFTGLIHGNRKFNPSIASFRAKAANYKGMAKNRNIQFDLTIEETISLLKGNCYYCGLPPSNYFNVRKNGKSSKKINYALNKIDDFDILYNGIDRINNLNGYTPENTVSCCYKCNTAKLNLSLDEFREWVKNVFNNLSLKKW
jgi:5-methylcytosine-specific restriction endonuclease McrA